MIKGQLKCSTSVMLLVLLVACVVSCTSYKKVPYLQNSHDFAKMEQVNVAFEPKIQPYDLLDVVVLSPDEPATSMSYNLIAPSDMSGRPVETNVRPRPYCGSNGGRSYDQFRSLLCKLCSEFPAAAQT